MRTTGRLLLAISACLLGGACTMPAFDFYAPPKASEVPNVAGAWRGTETLTHISPVNNGECLAEQLRARMGSVSEVELRITQTGITLTGDVTVPEGNRTTCVIEGRFSLASIFDVSTRLNAC